MTAASGACDAVLLVAFGGPEAPEEIRPFLETVAAGRPIPPERLDRVARQYEQIGGRSPLGPLTRRQAEALRDALAREGSPLPVWVGMRNWRPRLDDTLASMRDGGHQRALGIILSPFQSEASWDRYVGDVRRARERAGPGAPEVEWAPGWGDHPRFIECMADRVREALGRLPAARRPAARLIFTAHSIPVAMAAASPYATQLADAARAVAAALAHERWAIAYQSRSGSPRDPWLEPDVADALRAAAGDGTRDVVVVPVGFACDHVEVLYDLDVEAAAVARSLGLGFVRASAANDHPAFIAMLADLVRRGALAPSPGSR